MKHVSPSTELNENVQVVNGDELDEANTNIDSNQNSSNVEFNHTVTPSNTQYNETAETDEEQPELIQSSGI